MTTKREQQIAGDEHEQRRAHAIDDAVKHERKLGAKVAAEAEERKRAATARAAVAMTEESDVTVLDLRDGVAIFAGRVVSVHEDYSVTVRGRYHPDAFPKLAAAEKPVDDEVRVPAVCVRVDEPTRPVRSLADLRALAVEDRRYATLAIDSAVNLGGARGSLSDAMRWLELNANETAGERGGGEEGVVREVNALRRLPRR